MLFLLMLACRACGLATPSVRAALPTMVVFDLDGCLWTPEMYELYELPTDKDMISGDLEGGSGCVGVRSGGRVIRLFDGAREGAFDGGRVLCGNQISGALQTAT